MSATIHMAKAGISALARAFASALPAGILAVGARIRAMLSPRLIPALLVFFCLARSLAAQVTISSPEPIEPALPEYPAELLKMGGEGLVEIKVRVLATGAIQSVETRDVKGKGFADSCKAAVQQWAFKPAEFKGRRTDGVFLGWLQYSGGKVTIVVLRESEGKWTGPKVIAQVSPLYPYKAVGSEADGRVSLSFVVDWRGKAGDMSVLEATNPVFVQPALNAVMQWKFTPAKFEGRPVSARITVPIVFTREEGREPPRNFEVKGKPQDSLPEELRYDTPPTASVTVLVVYPYDAAVARETGSAEVRFLVGEDGGVLGTAVIKASKPEFGLALAAAMEAWKFEPALRDGKPSTALLNKSLNFKSGDPNIGVDKEAASLASRIRNGKFEPAKPNELDAPLKPKVAVPPVFPTALASAGTNGSAMIEVVVDKKGRAVLPKILKASAPEFGWAAATAAQRWLFEPPTVKGKPVEVVVAIPFKFNAPAVPKESAQ